MAQVNDPDLFTVAAARAGRAVGRNDDYVPENVADAHLEAFWGGNDSSSPMDMGFEILDWGPASELEVDTPAP